MKYYASLVLVLLCAAGCGQNVSFQKISNIPTDKAVADPSPALGLGPSPFPTPIPPVVPPSTKAFEENTTFSYTPSSAQFDQDTYAPNDTTLTYQVLDGFGYSVNRLQKTNFSVTENAVGVHNFKFSESTQRMGQPLDIVFVQDTTSALSDEIDAVKRDVIQFVSDLEKHSLKASLCLATYYQTMTKLCDEFPADDPNTPENENLQAFLDEYAALPIDSGGEIKQNSLEALVAVAQKTPWHPNSQHIIVLLNDDGFYVMPLDTHDPRAVNAPTYPAALAALQAAHVQTFIVGDRWPGYSGNYFQYPAIPEATGGHYFNLQDLNRGKVSIQSIFNFIHQQVSTTYSIEYASEDNPGLKATLPLSQRQIKMGLVGFPADYTVKNLAVQSLFPSGHADPKTGWALPSAKPVNGTALQVTVNGMTVPSGYHLSNNDLIFDQPPAPGARIVVIYEQGQLADNIPSGPIQLTGRQSIAGLEVWLNGLKAGNGDFALVQSSAGDWAVVLAPNVFSDSDPFGIRRQRGLRVKVRYNAQKI